MQHSLPQLLFRQCNANCLDTDMFSAEKEGEILCMKNCQDKTYAAFSMYMNLRVKQEKLRNDFTDHHSYSGLEPEHSAATVYIPQKAGTHMQLAPAKRFIKGNATENAEIRAKALIPGKSE